MDCWSADVDVLSKLRTSWNDKLEIVDGSLNLVEGRRSRRKGASITTNPEAIANHLESLINNTATTYFLELKFSESQSSEYYESIADFKRQVKCLKTRISDLQYVFRSFDCNQKSHADRYSALFEQAKSLWREVQDYKNSLEKPLLSKRPVKNIQYNERTDLYTIKHTYPKRVPLQATVEAAKQALLLAQPQQRPFLRCIKAIGKGLVFAVPLFAAGLLTVLKIVLWNPVEWLVQGEVRTISPLRWFLQKLKTDNPHMEAYQRFSTQLLHQPFITEEVVAAFKELAPQANLLDLGNAVLASEDITEFASFIQEDERPGAIPLDIYLNTMKDLCKQNNINLQTLRDVEQKYKLHNNVYLGDDSKEERKSINNFLDDMCGHLPKNADINQASAGMPYISPKMLMELLDSAASSSTCRKIKLSSSLAELETVRNFLSANSYRFKNEDEESKTYRKHSLV